MTYRTATHVARLARSDPRFQSEAFYFASIGDLLFVSPVSNYLPLLKRLSTADGARVDAAGAARGSSMKLLSLGEW